VKLHTITTEEAIYAMLFYDMDHMPP